MLIHKILLFLLIVISININGKTPQKLVKIDALLHDNRVEGAILIYNENTKEYFTNNFVRCNIGYTPASTFKILNSLVALEIGVVDLDTIFRWDGQKRPLESWQADMNLSTAFKLSCVPIYQDIARLVGLEKMQYYTRLLDFGEMDICADNLDKFWLEGNSKITQFQQIYFLRRLYQSSLPLRENVMDKVKQMMLLDETADYKIRAKTGWGKQDGKDIGWFVGYMETADNVFFFATNIEPTPETDMDNFATIRVDITKQILLYLLEK